MVNNIRAIAKRELKGYFNAPTAWLFIIIFLLAVSVFFFFVQQFFALDRSDLRPYFNLLPLFFSVLIPALTMKSWAEEKRQGTYEMLVTLPFSELDLVLGKFAAIFIVLLITLATTAFIPLTALFFGYFDIGQIIAQYIGTACFMGAAAAVGLFVSANARNQISAFIVTLLVLVLLNLMGQITLWFSLNGLAAQILNWISTSYHYISFAKGVLDTRDILYFVIIATAALYGTKARIYFQRWR